MSKTSRNLQACILVIAAMFALAPPATASPGDESQADPADCAASPKPDRCAQAITDLAAEIELVEEAYLDPDVDDLASFYHDDVVHYVRSLRRFARGKAEVRALLLEPLVAVAESATLDFSAVSYRYVHPDVVIAYGYVPGAITLHGGIEIVQPPLPTTMTWIRNHGADTERPYLLVAMQQGDYDGGAVPVVEASVCVGLPAVAGPHCAQSAEEVSSELQSFNQAFDPPDAEEASLFYDEDVVHYIGSFGRYFRGRDDLRDNVFDFYASVLSRADLDFSPYSYQAVTRDVMLTFGAISGSGEFIWGAPFVQSPLPQLVTWIRNPEHRDSTRPWVVVAAHE